MNPATSWDKRVSVWRSEGFEVVDMQTPRFTEGQMERAYVMGQECGAYEALIIAVPLVFWWILDLLVDLPTWAHALITILGLVLVTYAVLSVSLFFRRHLADDWAR